MEWQIEDINSKHRLDEFTTVNKSLDAYNAFQYLDEESKNGDITIPMFIDFRDSDLLIDYFEEV